MGKTLENKKFKIDRRVFLKLSALVGASTTFVGCSKPSANNSTEPAVEQAGERLKGTKVLSSMCSHNCWPGRCQIKANVKDGVLVSFATDDAGTDDIKNPQLRACLKGRAQRHRLYHPDRLKYPLKRVGERGEGKFERISWDEALDLIAKDLKRIKKNYGNEAFYINYSTGVYSHMNYCYDGAGYGGPLARLMNMFGGYLAYTGDYSSQCYNVLAPYMFGDQSFGNDYTDMVNSKLIVLFGFNPFVTNPSGVGAGYWITKAKERGAKVIVIDPRYTNTAATAADQWIPIKPTTDTALVAALAYVMVKENLYDKEFMAKYCVGFDEEHLPEGVPEGSSYLAYILGDQDGIPKTPKWAANITGIPETTIIQLARDIAMTKPCCIQQGFGIQRHACGEQVVRAVPILAAMSGNIGISGGGPALDSSSDSGPWVNIPFFPALENPVKATIPCFTWVEAIERGKEMTPKDGVQNAEGLSTNIKCVLNYGGNVLINQHSEINKTKEILKDTKKCELIVVFDNFMTPSATFADIVLPMTTQFEREDIIVSNPSIGMAIYGAKCVEPLYESKNIYDVCAELAPRLGIPKEKYTEGKTAEEWLQELLAEAPKEEPGFPSPEEFKKVGIYKKVPEKPLIALVDFIKDPVNNPLSTPTGKIEIFSKVLYDMNNPKEIPAIPKYVPCAEGPEDPLKEKYPLQLIGFHDLRRVHSMFDNIDWMDEVSEQSCWINPVDAKKRGLNKGDKVKVFNDRGTIIMPVKITPRIIPGVCAISEGGWYTPDKDGIDRRGAINTLTKYAPTPVAKGNPQHTNLVQVEKA